jgi:hypothetical protein
MCSPLRTSSLAPAEASSLQPATLSERETSARGPGKVRQGKRKRVVAGLASSDTIPALAVAGSQPPLDRPASSSATATATHARTRPPSIPSCSTALPACLPYSENILTSIIHNNYTFLHPGNVPKWEGRKGRHSSFLLPNLLYCKGFISRRPSGFQVEVRAAPNLHS